MKIAQHNQRLTLQDAADLLWLSRPTLVRMPDDGQIPFDPPGHHRRGGYVSTRRYSCGSLLYRDYGWVDVDPSP